MIDTAASHSGIVQSLADAIGAVPWGDPKPVQRPEDDENSTALAVPVVDLWIRLDGGEVVQVEASVWSSIPADAELIVGIDYLRHYRLTVETPDFRVGPREGLVTEGP